MCRSKFMNESRLRKFIEKYTTNKYLQDACMRVCASAVGFKIDDPEDFNKEDRAFLKRVRRMTYEQIDNSSVWYQYEFARKEGRMIIKNVKADLRVTL